MTCRNSSRFDFVNQITRRTESFISFAKKQTKMSFPVLNRTSNDNALLSRLQLSQPLKLGFVPNFKTACEGSRHFSAALIIKGKQANKLLFA